MKIVFCLLTLCALLIKGQFCPFPTFADITYPPDDKPTVEPPDDPGTICRPDFSYHGYWGADLFNTIPAPTVLWDSEDPVQIQQAANTGVRVLFYLQNLLLDFNTTMKRLSFKSGWKDIFDQNYGNITYPKNPYNVTGILAAGPNGFFMGSQLAWFGFSTSELEIYSSYINAAYPTALIAYDEDYRSFRFFTNVHGGYYDGSISTSVDLISISHFWPDVITWGIIVSSNIEEIYTDYILPHLASKQFIVWSTPAYSTNDTYKNSSCHSMYDDDCIKTMSFFMRAAVQFQCRDDICVDANQNNPYYHSEHVRGIWVWHWDSRPDLPGYEVGAKDIPLEDIFSEALSNPYSCLIVDSSASHMVATLSLIFLLINLIQ